MSDDKQASFFGEEQPKAQPDAQKTEQPPGNWHEKEIARLAELNLKYGAAHVYRRGGRLYAWGDFTHCPKGDIEHNLKVLVGMLVAEPGLTYVGKSYQADIYRERAKIGWRRVYLDVTEMYREKLLELGPDGAVISEANKAYFLSEEPENLKLPGI